MKTVLIFVGSVSVLAICFISFSCTKSFQCTCVAKSPNQQDLKFWIKDPHKDNAAKRCDNYEHDSKNNLDYDCTLK